MRSLFEGKWHFIEQWRQDGHVAGFLFDLEADFRDQRNPEVLFPKIVASREESQGAKRHIGGRA